MPRANAVRAADPLGLVRSHRQDILAIAARRGASNVRVFGSVARGDATPRSDVDFLVDIEPGRSLLDVAGLMLDLQDLLGLRVDVVEESAVDARDSRILAEAVPL